jgi:beta-phosphoglucomutase
MILANYFKVPTVDDLMRINPRLKLVLFDMDGTLVDTEKEHALAVIDVLKETVSKSFDFQEVMNIVFGCPDPYSFEVLKNKFSLNITMDDFLVKKHDSLEKILKSTSKEEDRVLAEIKNLVQNIKNHQLNITQAVVTASERKTAQTVLNTNFKDIFSTYFGREDTKLSKPFPDPYLHAFNTMHEKFGPFKREEVLLVEDSPYGLAAGVASGFKVIKASWYKI